MEQAYLDVLRKVLHEGKWKPNRTGIGTLMIDAAMMQFDLTKGFPAITTKHLAFRSVVGELIGFIRGFNSASQFRELGCKVWDDNANKNKDWLNNPARLGEDDLGLIYGCQWRQWFMPSDIHFDQHFDQLAAAVKMVQTDPSSRRILVNAWAVHDLDKMCLPPCHVMFQLLPDEESKIISMTVYMRSADMFLGVPFNIASYALLLELICKATGYRAKNLTMFMADTHIYLNHINQVDVQLKRRPFDPPKLVIAKPVTDSCSGIEYLDAVNPEEIWLENYDRHGELKGSMAI
jgi:thymidylate synthase